MRLPYGSLLALAFLATAARGQTEVDRLADLLALRSGMTVAEVGAGGGDFAVALAGRVGESGRVYATELEAGKRDEIRAAAERAGLANLEVLEAGISATGLPTSWYTDSFDDPNLPGEMQVSISLRKVDCGTELEIVQAGLPSLIPPENCTLGWQQSLSLLADLVEAEIPE